MANSNYAAQFTEGTNSTPQRQPLYGREPEMLENRAGGYVFAIDAMQQIRRFIILGTTDNTYYATSSEMTLENSRVILDAMKQGLGVAIVTLIDDLNTATIDEGGNKIPAAASFKAKGTCSFILALMRQHGNVAVKEAVHNCVINGNVVSTLAQLMDFVHNAKMLNNGVMPKGSGFRRAIGAWLNEREVRNLVMQLAKYRTRRKQTGVNSRGRPKYHKMTALDLLRIAHPAPSDADHSKIYAWVRDRATKAEYSIPSLDHIDAQKYVALFEQVQKTDKLDAILFGVLRHGLTWEMIPDTWFSDKKQAKLIWRALLGMPTNGLKPARYDDGAQRYTMPMMALLRNLPRLTNYGVFEDADARNFVVDMLTDDKAAERIIRARLHPIAIINAYFGYSLGKSGGKLEWEPIPMIRDALEQAFYTSFGTLLPSGKRTMVALDVSGSMSWFSDSVAGLQNLNPRDASAVMAMAIMRVERDYHLVAFSRDLISLNTGEYQIGKNDSLNNVIQTMDRIPMGGTDASLPMQYAQEQNLDIDTFIVLTDNETWAGDRHASQAIEQYRRHSGIEDAKLVVVAMTATRYSLTDQKDLNSLDVVGFDATAPQIIRDFSMGNV